MSVKKRALIFIESALYFRNFISAGAFTDIEKQYDVAYALPHRHHSKSVADTKEELEKLGKKVLEFEFPEKRALNLFYLTELSMARLSSKSRSFQIKVEKQPFSKRVRFESLLSKPGIFEIFRTLYLKRLGTNDSLNQVLSQFQPDLLILPTSLVDPLSLEVLQSNTKFNIPSVMLINGWDNLSSKGSIPRKPDFMGVWGDQSLHHAVDIHAMKATRVFKIGAPHFVLYEKPQQIQDRSQFLKALGIDPSKKVILFAGSARPFNETTPLLEIEKAIEQGLLPQDLHVIYRPHPWRHPRDVEEDFTQLDFKNMTMDPQVRFFYERSKGPSKIDAKPNDFLPDLNYYPNLLNAVGAVIQPCSTMMVESALMGKPSLVIAFGDGVHSFAPDTMIQFEHFKDALTMPGIIVCREPTAFVEDIQRMLKMSENPQTGQALKTQIKSIIHYENEPYSKRLIRHLDTIAH